MLTDTQWDYLLELASDPRSDLDIKVLNSLALAGLATLRGGKWRLTAKGNKVLATIIHA